MELPLLMFVFLMIIFGSVQVLINYICSHIVAQYGIQHQRLSKKEFESQHIIISTLFISGKKKKKKTQAMYI